MEMKKLFTSDNFFLAMLLFAVIGEAIYSSIDIFVYHYAIQAQLTLFFRLVCVIVLYISYKRHSKNVMKGMMGALLAAQLITSIQYLPELSTPVDYVCFPLFAVFSALLFINHFIINADRQPSPRLIRISQILSILLFLNNTVSEFLWLASVPDPLYYVLGIADILGFLGMTASVVCVESRLDAYRLDRESAGWTEEKGYPEGYVHEYEKK